MMRAISIHALREEGDRLSDGFSKPFHISIHALREEGDNMHKNLCATFCDFYPRPPRGGRLTNISVQAETKGISIHALREEGDNWHNRQAGTVRRFLSTPSARRATVRHGWSRPTPKYFYPRPPRGGRLIQIDRDEVARVISIHALREEGDADTEVL